MSVTLYKARVEDGSVVVEWKIIETAPTLDALTAALAYGWVTSEAVARAAALAVGPEDAPVFEAVPPPHAEDQTPSESGPIPDVLDDPDGAPPEDVQAPKSTARKKK